MRYKVDIWERKQKTLGHALGTLLPTLSSASQHRDPRTQQGHSGSRTGLRSPRGTSGGHQVRSGLYPKVQVKSEEEPEQIIEPRTARQREL